MLDTNTVFYFKKSMVIYLFITFSLFYSVNGAAMSLFGTDVVLFSPMDGRLTYQGKPAAHAKIVRHIIWKDDVGEKEIFYANEKGEFNLPIKREKVRIPLMGEFNIVQEIWVYYKEQEYGIWGRSKEDFKEYGELGGIPVNFRCELTDERVSLKKGHGLFRTSCKWDSIKEVKGAK
jgi:hypothetical protein